MSQTSFAFTKPFYCTTTSTTAVGSGSPPTYTYSTTSLSEVKNQAEWKARYVGVSTKTPRPWPAGKPGLKQWNSYSYTKKEFANSYSRAGFVAVGPPTSGQLRSRLMEGHYNHCFQGEPTPTYELNPPVSVAAQRLLAKIKAQDWNVAETLGEVATTAGMVDNIARRIGNAILAVKRGKVDRAMEILNVAARRQLGDAQKRVINRRYRTKRERQIASDWLAINYGVIPLLQDVQNAVKHLQNRADWPIQTQASASVDLSSKVSAESFAGILPGRFRYVGSVRGSAKAKYVVQYSVNAPAIAYFRSLGLTNVPSLAWELYPGSLIVDWLLPIGSWLSNMDATFGCTFSKGVLVTKTVTRFVNEGWLFPTSTYDSSGYGIKDYTVTVYQRSRITAFPTNFFPSFKNPLSVKHAANGLAFLIQAFHR